VIDLGWGQLKTAIAALKDPAALAQYVVVVIQGIAVQAASGASREALERAAETALRAWPS
jgi:hypothetical protein